MGLWHGVEHYEHKKVTEHSDTEFFVKGWDPVLVANTEFRYGWSYIVSWVGIGLTLCSAILFALAAVCIKNDKEREDAMNLQYLMPVYPQKQQPYGPYGYAAYPGPAAYYGSQYGLPYNQYWTSYSYISFLTENFISGKRPLDFPERNLGTRTRIQCSNNAPNIPAKGSAYRRWPIFFNSPSN